MFKETTGKMDQPDILYSYINIYPHPEEILKPRTLSISKNITHGSYRTVEYYLNTHFLLLREDFISPLREAIQSYKTSLNDVKGAKSDQFRIYKNAQFVQVESEAKVLRQLYKKVKHGVCANGKKRNDADKNFMCGSLLCFSSDNFEKMFFGTVAMLGDTPEGFIDVLLLRDIPFLYEQSYTMLECTQYFSPYCLILEALKNFDIHNFPMKKYIVDVANAREPPRYLTHSTRFTVKHRSFTVLNFTSWPAKETLELNEMQYAAFRYALTSKFAVIQGPPGTGKTYLGLRIARTLVENYESIGSSGPILIVSLTNHALDQFLEGLIPYTNDIIRFGQQTKSEQVRKFNFQSSKPNRLLRQPHYKKMEELLIIKRTKIGQLESALAYGGSFNNGRNDSLHIHNLQESLNSNSSDLKECLEKLGKCKQEEDYEKIRSSGTKVVGMTTSGAARYQHLLKKLRCPIVIVEEAAEVMESHIIISLTQHCEHLILTGDHQQLRPITADYRIGSEYFLGVSLFERMVLNGIHCITLDVQHRMRPAISELIVPAIYPNLKNHHSVYNMSNVLGLKHNVFFVSHTKLEVNVGKGKRNPHEAKYVVALAEYLIMQGYEPSKITILSMYKEQMHEIKAVQGSKSSKVCVTVVDTYQGEENDIILLSLVRSNQRGNIGFVANTNRICVALSRAKNGFYMIGHMKTLTRNCKMWHNIETVLNKKGELGFGLQLICQTHRRDIGVAVNPNDFVVDGGCGEPCNTKLKCGHVCPKKCHVVDVAHQNCRCEKPCARILCKERHPCPKKCWEECSPCQIPVKRSLACGYQPMVPCFIKTSEYVCQQSVEQLLLCGHYIVQPCFKNGKTECNRRCLEILSCGHSCPLSCHYRKNKCICLERCLRSRICSKLENNIHWVEPQ